MNDDMKEAWLNALMKSTLSNIEIIRDMANEYKLLDTLNFLNFMDDLNRLSIDPNRE